MSTATTAPAVIGPPRAADDRWMLAGGALARLWAAAVSLRVPRTDR